LINFFRKVDDIQRVAFLAYLKHDAEWAWDTSGFYTLAKKLSNIPRIFPYLVAFADTQRISDMKTLTSIGKSPPIHATKLVPRVSMI
jgi:hypothetical protein